METKSPYYKSRPPTGRVLRSWFILASGLQDRKQLLANSQVACKTENSCREARKRLARQKTIVWRLASSLQKRKHLLEDSQ